MQTSGDTASDCLPVDAHEVRHGASGQVFREPGDVQVKLSCKAASGISPRNCSRDNTMLRTADSVYRAFNLYQNAAPVQFSPHLWLFRWLVISLTVSATEGAVIFMPDIRTGLDADMGHDILIVVNTVGLYNSVLDIEHFLHKVSAEAILSLSCIVDVWPLILYRSQGGFCNM